MQRSKETLTESRCREAMGKDDLVEDSVPQIMEYHRMKICMSWMSRLLVHVQVDLKIPESSAETAAGNFKVPASRQHPQAATNAENPGSGVLTEVMDVPPMLSLTSGVHKI